MNEIELLGSIPGVVVKEKIASGGMGSVYKAYQAALDRTVALKIVRPEFFDKKGMDLFQREAQVLAKIRHPGIVQILEFHPDHPLPYFLMEYVDGVPLDESVRGRPWKERVALFREVVAIVRGAHDHGVVHGDLKPSNILVDRRSRPYVLDFGLAHLTRIQPGLGDPKEPQGGTPGYLAPEVIGGDPSSFESDVFALGATLYVLLTGVVPFASFLASVGGKPKLLLEHNSDIPEPLQRICFKAMEQDPAERYRTAEHFENDLGRFLAGKTIDARPTVYKTELHGRLVNHLADLSLWEKEGFLSRRERDELVVPYDKLRGQDSPWLSETRKFLTGPLLMRVGAWLLLLSALLWPVFYWDKINQTARVASSGIPTGIMAALGVWFLVRRDRKNAVASLGSFALQLLVFLLILFSEFGWLRYPQPPQWELWGSWEENGPPKPRPVKLPGVDRDGFRPPDELLDQQPTRPPSAFGATLRPYADFILSNSQMLAAVAAVTICIVLLMFLLKAPFFAPWLSAACLAMAALTLLMIGDKERLLRGNVAWVGVHGVVVSALFLVVGYVIEWATAPRVARTFYWTGTALFAVSTWVVAAFGTKEWLRGSISYDDDTLNLWLLTYSVPFFLCGLCAERFGTEGQRNLAWVYYYLVPVFLLVPLNLLVSSGWEIWDIGEEPFTIYEIIYLLASVGLLVVGRCLHIRAFIFAGLWGLAIFVMRMTYRHLLDYLAWPVVVGIAGGAALSLGILLPLWLQRRREPHRARPKALQAPASTMPARPEPETLPLPGN